MCGAPGHTFNHAYSHLLAPSQLSAHTASYMCRCSRMALSCLCKPSYTTTPGSSLMCRVGQNRIYTPYMTVYMVISLPKIPYTHRTYIWFWPTLLMRHTKICSICAHLFTCANLHTSYEMTLNVSHQVMLHICKPTYTSYPVRRTRLVPWQARTQNITAHMHSPASHVQTDIRHMMSHFLSDVRALFLGKHVPKTLPHSLERAHLYLRSHLFDVHTILITAHAQNVVTCAHPFHHSTCIKYRNMRTPFSLQHMHQILSQARRSKALFCLPRMNKKLSPQACRSNHNFAYSTCTK